MSGSRAPYMEWAKTRPKPEIDLAGSNLIPCTLDDLPGAREAVDIAGESPEGYPPLKDAIAKHHGVTPQGTPDLEPVTAQAGRTDQDQSPRCAQTG